MAVSGQPVPRPASPFPPFSPACSRFAWRGQGEQGLSQSAEKTPHCVPSLCVSYLDFSTPEAVPFAEEMSYRFVFAEEIRELEAGLQSIGAGVRPPGSNPDSSSD